MGRAPAINGSSERVKSADRALDLLELLAAREDGLSFQEVAAALGVPKSSAHGLLQTLARRGYAELRPGERRFRLGRSAARLAARPSGEASLLDRARDEVAALARATGEAAHLAELDGVYVRYRFSDEGGQRMRLVAPGGGLVPAHATAVGKALLAMLSDDEVRARYEAGGLDTEALPQLTRRTVRRLPLLLRQLAEVRRLGHAHDVGGYAEGV